MSGDGSQIKTRKRDRDKDRKWMWWLLGVIGALQLYFVRELLAAFALFAMGFLAANFVIDDKRARLCYAALLGVAAVTSIVPSR